MQSARCFLVVLFALGSLGGCAGTNPIKDLGRYFQSAEVEVKNFFQRGGVEVKRLFQTEAKPQLLAGIRFYETGRHKEAVTRLQSALDAGLDNADQITAHKYLAFANCALGRDRQCRAHFRTALELDPSFALQPAEVGDPSVGPVFRQAKARR